MSVFELDFHELDCRAKTFYMRDCVSILCISKLLLFKTLKLVTNNAGALFRFLNHFKLVFLFSFNNKTLFNLSFLWPYLYYIRV